MKLYGVMAAVLVSLSSILCEQYCTILCEHYCTKRCVLQLQNVNFSGSLLYISMHLDLSMYHVYLVQVWYSFPNFAKIARHPSFSNLTLVSY